MGIGGSSGEGEKKQKKKRKDEKRERKRMGRGIEYSEVETEKRGWLGVVGLCCGFVC